MPTYQVFTRTWWKKEKKQTVFGIKEKLVPHKGRKSIVGYASTIEEARRMCDEWNANNNPGQLSRKAEFTSDY